MSGKGRISQILCGNSWSPLNSQCCHTRGSGFKVCSCGSPEIPKRNKNQQLFRSLWLKLSGVFEGSEFYVFYHAFCSVNSLQPSTQGDGGAAIHMALDGCGSGLFYRPLPVLCRCSDKQGTFCVGRDTFLPSLPFSAFQRWAGWGLQG